MNQPTRWTRTGVSHEDGPPTPSATHGPQAAAAPVFALRPSLSECRVPQPLVWLVPYPALRGGNPRGAVLAAPAEGRCGMSQPKYRARARVTRPCLRCERDFQSSGANNRLCVWCLAELRDEAPPEEPYTLEVRQRSSTWQLLDDLLTGD